MVPGGGTESDLREKAKVNKRQSWRRWCKGGLDGSEWGQRARGKPAPQRQVQHGCSKSETRRP